MSILLDAGPVLNFVAVSEQGLLLVLADQHGLRLSVPERVRQEVERKAGQGRFARTGAMRTWRTLVTDGRVTVLDDTLKDDTFADAVARVSGMPAVARVRTGKDLGEILVIAHASALAQQGHDVVVLIDDGDGRRRAALETEWLRTRRGAGALRLWRTEQVLRQTCPDRWRAVYTRMRGFDDGLPPLVG